MINKRHKLTALNPKFYNIYQFFIFFNLNRLGSVHQLTKISSSYFRAISWCLDTHFGENARLPTVLTSLPQFSKC